MWATLEIADIIHGVLMILRRHRGPQAESAEPPRPSAGGVCGRSSSPVQATGWTSSRCETMISRMDGQGLLAGGGQRWPNVTGQRLRESFQAACDQDQSADVLDA